MGEGLGAGGHATRRHVLNAAARPRFLAPDYFRALCLRRDGKVILNRAIGHGWGNAPEDPPDAEKIPVQTDTPFCAWSAAKAVATTVVHMLVELYARSQDEATDVLESAARGDLAITSLAEESRPPAAGTNSGGADLH